jgi:putative Ig domain-containing protein/glucodextranase-like protein
MRTPWWRAALLVTVLVATPVLSYGQTVTAMWDANPPAQLVLTYDVCVGTTSLSCNFKNVSVPATDTSYTFLPNAGVLYRVAVRAVSAAGAGAYAPEVVVSTPALGTLSNRTSTVNAAIAPVTIAATDPDGSPLTFTHTGLPFGLTLNQSTGVITGTPTSTGTYSVTIFVTDGLATAAAAFVWTVQTQSTDTVPPTLSITSHTTGQTVTTSSITLSGTATDSGAGNSGIQSVTVNGAAATGGTATGSNTANWSRSVSLASGANTLTVVATDGVGNARTSSITITRSATASLSLTSFTSNVASPQNNGSAITFTAVAAGGTAPYQFKFWIYNGTAWTIGQNWSTSASYTWRPTAGGNYIVAVWVRNAGVEADASQALAQVNFVINAPVLSVTNLTSTLASPQLANTSIGFTATATGGSAPYQFKWWVFNGTVWSIAQNWSTSATLSWRPSSAGTYIVAVWARNAGVAVDAAQAMAQVNYTISGSGSPLAVSTLSSTLASPQAFGSTIGFTATASGGTAPYQFKWWVFNGTAWSIAQNWSTASTLSWRPNTPGSYIVAVWARNAGVTTDAAQAMAQVNYVVSSSSAPLTVSMGSNLPSPQAVGTIVNFTVAGSGGTGSYQFKWWVFNGVVWSVAQDWSTSTTMAWRPISMGSYMVAVWARNAGVTADAAQALAQVNYTVVSGTTAIPVVTSLTATLTSPQVRGTTVIFTATVAGGSAPYQFKWWVFDGITWSVAQNWSTSATYTWGPTMGGNYTVAVWVRNAGVEADASQALAQMPYTLTP